MILCAFLACSAACFEDDVLKNMRNENDDLYYYVDEDDLTLRTYFMISDSGATTSYIDGDDAFYQNKPSAISYTVYNNYSDNDDIVNDNITGLMWTKCSALDDSTMDTSDSCSGANGTYTWSQASSFCANLEFAGYSNWRLPTAPELFSLVNFEQINPAIDTTFPNSSPGRYWTSTLSWFFVDCYWYINFDSTQLDLLQINTPDNTYYVRCVLD